MGTAILADKLSKSYGNTAAVLGIPTFGRRDLAGA
jgi:hypothetical protein